MKSVIGHLLNFVAKKLQKSSTLKEYHDTIVATFLQQFCNNFATILQQIAINYYKINI